MFFSFTLLRIMSYFICVCDKNINQSILLGVTIDTACLYSDQNKCNVTFVLFQEVDQLLFS